MPKKDLPVTPIEELQLTKDETIIRLRKTIDSMNKTIGELYEEISDLKERNDEMDVELRKEKLSKQYNGEKQKIQELEKIITQWKPTVEAAQVIAKQNQAMRNLLKEII